MRLRLSALAAAIIFAFPAQACDISLPLYEGMFADLDVPVDQLTSLGSNAGAFEYLDETQLDTLVLTHSGKTFPWTASNTAATCASPERGRSCRVIADTETRFGKITLTRETVGSRTQLRYRLLLVEGRRHLRLFPPPATTRTNAACNLMKALDVFRRSYMTP